MIIPPSGDAMSRLSETLGAPRCSELGLARLDCGVHGSAFLGPLLLRGSAIFGALRHTSAAIGERPHLADGTLLFRLPHGAPPFLHRSVGERPPLAAVASVTPPPLHPNNPTKISGFLEATVAFF